MALVAPNRSAAGVQMPCASGQARQLGAGPSETVSRVKSVLLSLYIYIFLYITINQNVSKSVDSLVGLRLE